MTYCIDAHFHLWHYSAAQYGWIDDSMQALRGDFLPAQLQAEMKAAEVQAGIAVQARQDLEETRWLLHLAGENSSIAGVVGWAELASAAFPAQLETLAGDRWLKGLRHILQDEPDDGYMLRDDFNRGISLLHSASLVYDILIFERHLPIAVQFIDRHPEQAFVLDHLAKPKIRGGEISPWRENVRELARRPNVFCKISGMVTEAHWQHWNADDLRPFLEVALECFGAKRLMAGSDWPVCTLASSYSRWWQVLREWAAALSTDEQRSILGGNAAEVYRLETEP